MTGKKTKKSTTVKATNAGSKNNVVENNGKAAVAPPVGSKRKATDDLTNKPTKTRAKPGVANPKPAPVAKPTGEWALKAIAKWNLQPPYDTEITEAQWEKYYTVRSEINVPDGGELYDGFSFQEDDAEERNDESIPHEILLDIRDALSVTIANCKGLPGREGLSDALSKGFYLLDISGCADDDSPRTVESTSRIYSPLGNGNFVDLSYDFHHRVRWASIERFATLNIALGDIGNASSNRCLAAGKQAKKIKIFSMHHDEKLRNDKRTLASVPNLKLVEEHLFGTSKKISPLKIYKFLLNAGGVMFFNEEDMGWTKREGKCRYSRLKDEESESDNEPKRDRKSNEPMTPPRGRGGFDPFGELYDSDDEGAYYDSEEEELAEYGFAPF